MDGKQPQARVFRESTIHAAFLETVGLVPNKPAIVYKGRDGQQKTLTYRDLAAVVDRVAESLIRIGVAKGDKAAVCAYHGPDWVIADLAIAKIGAIVVPVYHTLSPQAAAYILRDSGAKLVFVDGAREFDAIEQLRGDLPLLRAVAVFATEGLEARNGFLAFDDMKSGQGLSREIAGTGVASAMELPVPGDAASVVEGPAPDDVATIVYTSGTTGEPKGVMLTHAGIVANTIAGIERFRVAPDDVFLSVLPMCHMLEKIAGCYSHIFAGATIVYGGGISSLVEDARRFRPTNFVVVPRIIEKVCEAAAEKIRRSSPFTRLMVGAAVSNLNRATNLKYRGMRVPPLLRLKCWYLDRAVAARFRKIAGGRVRFVVSGGAPLDKKLAKLLFIMGINIVGGYGLTEASLVVSTSALEDNRLGTVGKPYPGVEIKIGEDQEILVKGPSLMKGYYKRPEDTARTIDNQGWLHTGDQGRFDDRGNLVISGRIKEILVTSYGKNIGPAFIEGKIMQSPFIDQAMVCGDKQKYLTALVVPSRKMVEGYARRRSLRTGDYPDLLNNPAVRQMIAEEIDKTTTDCSPYEKVRNFLLLPEGFTVENDLLTPTLKLRRPKIEQRYADGIAAMYTAAGAVQ
jgi:long-chain acyl-CoA synthetase